MMESKIENSQVIHKKFAAAVAAHPGRIAGRIRSDGQWREWTYAELNESALRIAAYLIRAGLHKQERACLVLENRPEWGAIYIGVMYAGMTCVPLDAQTAGKDLERFISDCSARVIFCSRRIFHERLPVKLPDSVEKLIVLDLKKDAHPGAVSYDEIQHDSHPPDAWPEVGPQDVASLIYTSGTTDRPKGVLLTHNNICSNYASIRKLELVYPTDNFIALLPLHHTYPFMATLILPLLMGAEITFVPLGFNPKDLSDLIKEKRVTVLVSVPQVLALIRRSIQQKIPQRPAFLGSLLLPFIKHGVRQQFGGQLRLLVSGGAKLEAQIGRDLKRWGLNVVEGYGLTETSPVVTFNPPKRVKYGSVGKPIPGVKVRIDGPAGPLGEGEVLVQGPNVMKGYYQRPELTAATITDGWFCTGDVGYFDKEGYLHITGRRKEMIVLSSGKNIYPEDLERHFLKSPFIKENCVFERMEKRFGQEKEALHAVIVPNLEYFGKAGERNVRDRIHWEVENCSRDLPAYEHILGFTLTREELPKTALGKLQRYLIKDKYSQPKAVVAGRAEKEAREEEQAGLDPQVTEKVKRYLSRQLHEEVFLDQHLEIDLGIDSLSRVELGMGLEKLFSIKMPDEALAEVATVRDVAAKVMEQLATATTTKVYESQVQETPWEELLKHPPSEELRAKIKLKPGLGDWALMGFFMVLFRSLFKILFFGRVRKAAPLAKTGPYLITPNHASYLDGFAIFCGLPLSVAVNTYFIGWSAIFEHPSIRWTNKPAHLVPIDTGANFIEAMQAAAYLLNNNKIVCIFPEGQRSIDGKVKDFKKGVGVLVRELNVDAVPVLIKGTFEAWPWNRRWPRPYPVKVIFGRKLAKRGLLGAEQGSAVQEYGLIASRLREELLDLKNA